MHLDQLKTEVITALWTRDLDSLPQWKAWPFKIAQFAFVVARDLTGGQLSLRAMSLVYTTLLSLVPLLAVSFSVLKAFGVHNRIEPVLGDLLEPLGERAGEVTDRLIAFVENMNVGVLGSVGFALLFYTVISLVQKIERAFNDIWHVDTDRAFARRVTDYLSVILLGPVLVFSALGAFATVMATDIVQSLVEVEPLGQLLALASRLVPFLMLAGAFTFLYAFLPNTKVRLLPALVGGIIAALLWETIGWAFTSFVVASAKYTLIYSTFAALVFFMIWLYLAWLILLIGASMAYYQQHPEHMAMNAEEPCLSNRLKEKLALLIMSQVGKDFYAGQPPIGERALARRLKVPTTALEAPLEALTSEGLLAQAAGGTTGGSTACYLPARPLDTTSVRDVLAAVRGSQERQPWNKSLVSEPAVDMLLETLDASVDEAFGSCTLKDLVEGRLVKSAEGEG